MSNRRASFIWVTLSIESAHIFRISLPIPLLMFLGLSDFLEDAAFFIPSKATKKNGKGMSPSAVKQIVLACSDFLREIALHTEPFDLADIDIIDGHRKFVLKCLLK